MASFFRNLKKILYLSAIILLIILLINIISIIQKGNDHFPYKSLCQSTDAIELAKAPKTKHGIPLILHQIFKSEIVPIQYIPFIQSCGRVNSDFIHVIWTDPIARQFVKTYYPEYEQIYTRYKIGIEKGDYIRYLILYHFGGVYVDMDAECIRPLSQHLDKFNSSLILDKERELQTRLLWKREFLVMNSVMIARPKHPFFKYMLDRFFLTVNKEDVMYKTGPIVLSDRFNEYMKQSNLSPEDKVTLADSHLFSPKLDAGLFSHFTNICKIILKLGKKHYAIMKPGCMEWEKQGRRQEDEEVMRSKALLLHHFLHLGYPRYYKLIRRQDHACLYVPKLAKFSFDRS